MKIDVRRPWPEIGVLLIAALTRFWRLGYHSVWFDEAVSLAWAGTDPAFIWRMTFPLAEDKHPPVYYLLLHGWQTTLGWVGAERSDTALRALGALLGVLTVWGLLLLVRRLSGRTTSLLAGLLAALAPLLVWYSQELRMFQPATTALIWSAYWLLRGWQGERFVARLGWLLAFVLAMTAALYSYLFAAFLLPAAGLTLVALLVVERRATGVWPLRRFVEGAAAVGAAGLLFLPLARNAWLVNAAENTPGRAFQDFALNTQHLLRIFTVWRIDWPDPLITIALLFLAALLLIGLSLPSTPLAPRPSQPAPRFLLLAQLWLILWLGVPFLIANLLLSQSDAVFREDRYLLFLAPFALWAIARGITVLGQRQSVAGIVLAVLTVGLFVASLPRLWTPALYRENWRAAAEYVIEYEQRSPELPAAVVAHVDYTRRPLEWYLRPTVDATTLPIFFPFGGTLTPEMVDDVIAPPLEGLIDFGAETLWLTQSHLEGVDDAGLVEGWLNANFPLITEQFPAGVKLSGYALRHRYDALPELGDGAVYPTTELAPGLTLAACEILTPELRATDEALHPPSGWVHVRLWWEATGPIDDDYVALVQMIGPEGVWGDRLYRENEALRRTPTTSWMPGEIVRDEVDVNLNPLTPPGEYPIVVGVMDSGGEAGAAWAECGRVRIHN